MRRKKRALGVRAFYSRITLEGGTMKTLRAGIITTAGAILLITALTPLALSDESTSIEPATSPADASQVLPATHEVARKRGDGNLVPSGCLSSTPLTCADLPSTYNSTCSCSSTLQPVKCRSCDGGKGQVLKTTCTIDFTCNSPICDLQQNITRTSLSCAT
ncbi:MAG: hypothetical protein O7D35_00965 [Acidobacteria bacterium]|nr:hypothetical protein [Acidobacteriota bacterium]